MSAPYPTGDQNPPYPGAPYGAGVASPYPPQNQWGQSQPGLQPPPYPPNVGFQMPGYPPQQNFTPGYPPQQPQPGYPSGYPGYQPQNDYDPNKPMNPPYMDDTDPNYAKGLGFDDKSIRAGFIRRVYSILSLQLLVTLGFVALFQLHGPTRLFVYKNPQLMIIPMVGTLVLVCVMACFESARRTSPLNIILLGLFTLMESILVGFIASTYQADIVLQAVALTAVIVIGLTIFAFQTKIDFTMCGGFLCIMLMIFVFGSIIAGFFLPRGSNLGNFIIACIGVAIFAMYIVYDTQIMIGGEHKYSISPEEYIFAALNLYMDIIQMFIYLLRILKYLNHD